MSDSSGQEQQGGMSTLDLMGTSPAVRRVIRLMLRQSTMSYTALFEANEALPEEKRLSRVELDEAIDTLCEMDWLIREEIGEETAYSVKLKRKEGSEVTRASTGVKTGSTIQKLWDAVEEVAEEEHVPSPAITDAAPTGAEPEESTKKPDRGFFRGLFGKK